MLFNSFQFLLFFPVVTILYFLLPHRWRWLHLLIASCVFYAAFIPAYLLILFFTIIVDYYAGILIEGATGTRRKMWLVMSIITNVGTLAVFKYYNFFAGSINDLLVSLHITGAALPLLKLILPIGLSFHTFQAMSYTIEVYRGHHKAERHFGIYALYVMFYPQLVAGPIERPQNILYQFHEKKYFDYNNVTSGLRLMLWGLLKKVVVADRLAQITDPVFNSPHLFSPLVLLMATVFFSFQIYCDFSGYSDIALGSARVMGFKLMKNFDTPYYAKNISEFWKRWHISLSTWFRDYLYISLGGNRVSVPRWYFNLFFVFLVSGLWHGANWTFIVWGALHGFYLVFAIVTQKPRDFINEKTGLKRIPWLYNTVQMFTTYCLVTFAWIFFRANTISDAGFIARRIPHAVTDVLAMVKRGVNAQSIRDAFGYIPVYMPDVVMGLLVIAGLELAQWLQRRYHVTSLLQQKPRYVRWAVYYTCIVLIVFCGVYQNRQFIYFQF
ncbi:MBOAT family O-acyltransferase [Deminuibacter soli]|uniref:MBOAT family protein n=1 Tax=Deminuibacter soli TaxID=2291815 RepID=A0A3E1NKD5_9BACT|nr:MBOAT family O-acyltransferase [Deminuibacter soli]RFM28341.1 MBOAT family protein [Deminuibacter soli]